MFCSYGMHARAENRSMRSFCTATLRLALPKIYANATQSGQMVPSCARGPRVQDPADLLTLHAVRMHTAEHWSGWGPSPNRGSPGLRTAFCERYRHYPVAKSERAQTSSVKSRCVAGASQAHRPRTHMPLAHVAAPREGLRCPKHRRKFSQGACTPRKVTHQATSVSA